MSEELVLHQREGSLVTLTLNRPDRLNSVNQPLAAALLQHLTDCSEDAAVRAVLLTGAGRAFCAGQDLAEAVPADGSKGPSLEQLIEQGYNPIIRAIRTMEKPVVVAVNGVAAGAGANLALAGDFVLAAESAAFIQAFSKIGVIPDSGGTFILPRLVGPARATALMMLGEKLSADEAKQIGMIYDVCSDSELMDKARDLAAKLADMPTRALGLTKRLLNASAANDLQTQLDMERDAQAEAGNTSDYREGVRAFQEKRAPKFTGS